MVPRFLAALGAAGARPHRVDAYLTTLGATPESCSVEAWMLMSGHIHAVALSSTAEVGVVFVAAVCVAMWPNGQPDLEAVLYPDVPYDCMRLFKVQYVFLLLLISVTSLVPNAVFSSLWFSDMHSDDIPHMTRWHAGTRIAAPHGGEREIRSCRERARHLAGGAWPIYCRGRRQNL